MIFLRHAVLLLLVVFVSTPAMAVAQTPYTNWRSSQQTTTDDGTTSEQRQQFRGWRQSSEFQQKIAALGSVPVQLLPIPVLFGVGLSNMSPNFGDPRDGGARTHEGEDIMAESGTPIVSPTDAVVIRIGVGTGQGNYVTTANPGGETFVYMHLDRFAEGIVAGSVLSPGSLIGYVGNTGNASGGAAHLHFEVYDQNGTPLDPFLRLTAEFTLAEKISFLPVLLVQAADPASLSQFLVTHFRSTFSSAEQSGILLPSLITTALATVPYAALASARDYLPAGDLDIGSSGTAVVILQQFLITYAAGPASIRLAGATATGYFGPVTQAALIEYQEAVAITPANGYYGPVTDAFVKAGTPVRVVTPAPNTPALEVMALTRNVYLGISGEDVLALQKFLNIHGFTVAVSGAGSIGEETRYFGPATQAAVIQFQGAHSITPAVGYVGPLTRAALATLTF